MLMRGVRVETLYNILGGTYISECNSTVVCENEPDGAPAHPEEKKIFSHRRMGHIGEKGLCVFHTKGMVEGIPICSLDLDLCEHCIYGKKNRV